MATVIINGEAIDTATGESLLDLARRSAAVEQIATSCPGNGQCGECIVQITAGHEALSPPAPTEAFLAGASDTEEHVFRLACQACVARDDAEIHVETFKRKLAIATSGQTVTVDLDPWVARADGRIVEIDSAAGHEPDGATAFGLAIDVGTTTVVIHVVDLSTGRTRDVRAFENPQKYGGSDVMSRVGYDRDHAGRLHRTMIGHVNNALLSLDVDPASIIAAAVAGNATMRDLFFGLDVQTLGQQPFMSSTQLDVRDGKRATTALSRRAGELGIAIHPEAIVYGLPLISHHVGADTAAVLATLDIETTVPFMMIDIGTNTEVVIGDGERLFAASCAAGPAFEGGHVACGMPACDGAIAELRREDGAWDMVTIGEAAPRGICGSGLVDVLAELRRSDEMDELGRFAGGADRIEIHPAPPIALTRADASELAQTKSAIGLGQAVLLRRLGITAADLKVYYLAGAFASKINLDSARRVGLVPPVRDDQVQRIGNASVEGARAVLINRACRRQLESLVTRIEHVQLETEPDFFDLYADMTRLVPLDMGDGA